MNELLLIISVVFIFSSVLVLYKLFGVVGLFAGTVIATITANIEVLILVEAFGIEQTLGNVLFASTFLCSDIASEIYGKKIANKVVNLGIVTSILFIVLTQSWLNYLPSPNDFIFEHMQAVFSNTPRVMIAGLLVYAISQRFDVWMYEFIWNKTDKIFGEHRKFLWLRNNGSTLLSQLVNAFLFTFGAFYGIFDMATLLSILWSSYLIFMILALVDTAFVYMARSIHDKGYVKEIL